MVRRWMILVIGVTLGLSFSLGTGVYAWFTTSSEVKSNISTASFEMSIESGEKGASGNAVLLNASKLSPIKYIAEPEKAVQINSITVRNNGTIDMKLYDGSFGIAHEKNGVRWMGDNKKCFRINLLITKSPQVPGDESVVIKINDIAFEDLENALKDVLKVPIELKAAREGSNLPAEFVTITGSAWLNENADSGYQGITTTISLILKAKQFNDNETVQNNK